MKKQNQGHEELAYQLELEKAREIHRQGDLGKAESLYRGLLSKKKDGDTAAALGALLRSKNRREDAEALYSWAMNNCNWTPILVSNACNWYRENGKNAETVNYLKQALSIWPEDIRIKWGMALSLHHAGKPIIAMQFLDNLIQQEGEKKLLLEELAACQISSERYDEAVNTTEKLERIDPNNTRYVKQRYLLMIRTGNFKTATKLLKSECRLNKDELAKISAIIKMQTKQYASAEKIFIKLTIEDPKDADNWLNLACCQRAMKKMVRPLKTLQSAVNINPDRTDLTQALGSLLVEHGKKQEGLVLLKRALKSESTTDVQYFNFQYACSGYLLIESKEAKASAKDWEKKRGLKPLNIWKDTFREMSKKKKIRLGYFSQDFHNHPVGRFIEPIIERHDRDIFEVIAINCGTVYDEQTERIKCKADKWLDVSLDNDIVGARKISNEQIDIIVELGGYTGGSRIRMLTAKPAPIQLSYLGYFADTFLDCIDGWIGDSAVFEKANLGNEQQEDYMYRLASCYMAYRPEKSVRVRREVKDGYFRFGCFNHSRKLNEETIDLFASILREVSDSKLVLKSQTFGEEEEKERILRKMIKRGIDKSRLEILNRTESTLEHLQCYGLMDVALDPIPYGGATTTAEALWMGVPVICLEGKNMVERLGSAVLTGAGLQSAIAGNIKEYVEIAKRMASVGVRNTQKREELREYIQRSDLMNEGKLAKELERCYKFYLELYRGKSL